MAISLIIWLICVGISAIMIAYALKGNHFVSGFLSDPEGFTTNIVMTSCPPGAAQYVTPKGDTNCCEGDIVNKQCNGSTICSLSPKPPDGMQSCSDWMNKQWAERSMRFCPRSMPNYYGPIQRVANGKDEGCSKSPTANDGSKPEDITQSRCKIYSRESDEYSKLDSCFNQKALDAMTATGHRSIIPMGDGRPALLISTGVPADGSSVVPTTCYDLNRAIRYLEKNNDGLANMLKKDPCALGKGVICGIDCRPSNPTGYVMMGDDIQGEIPVQKIASGEFPSGAQLNLYFAQNGSNIAGTMTLISDPSRVLNGVSFPGKLSDNNFTDITSYLKTDLARKFDGAPKKQYKVRKV